ncbi:putative protein phosphatase 2C 26 [Morella rubra]|uniref:Protein phosphatase n=1 Tax=Morella rubra TaxID=262757 RepID=A0A6A1UPZ5_9ROSI|nr:putative protein phosphatase 2C 26 [Morella rubra]
MAIPLIRASISRSQSLSLPSSFSSIDESSLRRKRLLSCVPSEVNPVRSEVSLTVGTHLIPHPNKVDKGGEDAFFVSNYNGGVIAVADGVSGWAEQNVDPSLFPQELMANASFMVGDDELTHQGMLTTEQVNNDPQILLRKAHAATSSTGSATVIVAMLERNGILKIANVGDCGVKVIREGQIFFSTSPQEHYFDCPYQLSSEVVGQTYLDAMVSSVELMEGDTMVMGSDGLFDNVFDHEILSTIARHRDVAGAAKALANLASSHSMDANFDSPYSLEARSKCGIDASIVKRLAVIDVKKPHPLPLSSISLKKQLEKS